jgi:hypothetical protein
MGGVYELVSSEMIGCNVLNQQADKITEPVIFGLRDAFLGYSTKMPPQRGHQLVQNEGRIQLAIQAFKSRQFKSLSAAVAAYDVAYSTAYDRMKGRPARVDSRTTTTKLTATEESVLVQWILSMDNRGLAPRAPAVQQMANLLLAKRSESSEEKLTVGKLWVKRFVQRQEALQSKYNRKYDYQRAKCEDPALIRDWFRLVQNTITKYGIQTEDIYNFDETGFQMGVVSTAKVITGSERAKRLVTL